MANLCIARIRSNHELAWNVPPLLRQAASTLHLGYVDRVLAGIDGKPFLAQLTAWYLAALGEQTARRLGLSLAFQVVEAREEDFRAPAGTDAVLFTVNTPAAPATYRVADRLRAEGVRVVLGGIHPTMLPEEAGAHADAVATGEAEAVFDELLQDLAADRLRPLYRGGRCASLAGLAIPRWPQPPAPDLCPWVVPVQTSRGCRNACAFCSTTRHQGPERRHRPVADIVAEIRSYQESGFLTRDKGLFLTDNNSVSDSDHRRGIRDTTYARELFSALEPLGVTWTGQGEISVADDPELLDRLARSGCRMLLVGFESLDGNNLSDVGKPLADVETYARRIAALHRHGIKLIGCFILGLDNDTPEVFDRTAAFIEEHVDVPQLSLMTPFPGTALYARLEREGRILHRDWSRYDITHVTFRPRHMAPEELEARFRALLKRTFSWPHMLTRATRTALTAVREGAARDPLWLRWLAAFAPNLVYGSLGWVDPGNGASARVRPQELQRLRRAESEPAAA